MCSCALFFLEITIQRQRVSAQEWRAVILSLAYTQLLPPPPPRALPLMPPSLPNMCHCSALCASHACATRGQTHHGAAPRHDRGGAGPGKLMRPPTPHLEQL